MMSANCQQIVKVKRKVAKKTRAADAVNVCLFIFRKK